MHTYTHTHLHAHLHTPTSTPPAHSHIAATGSKLELLETSSTVGSFQSVASDVNLSAATDTTSGSTVARPSAQQKKDSSSESPTPGVAV